MLAQGQHAYHLSGTALTHSLYQPAHTVFLQLQKNKRATCVSILWTYSTYLAFQPLRFTMPLLLPTKRGSLTPPFHPYLTLRQSGLFSVALAVT